MTRPHDPAVPQTAILDELLDRIKAAEAERDAMQQKVDDLMRRLDENGVPIADGMGTFTPVGRVQAYIDNMAEARDQLRRALRELVDQWRASVKNDPYIAPSQAISSCADDVAACLADALDRQHEEKHDDDPLARRDKRSDPDDDPPHGPIGDTSTLSAEKEQEP